MDCYARHTDQGIEIRAAENVADLPDPEEWRRVPNPAEHISGSGFARLDGGGRILFTWRDQSYPDLAALFAEEAESLDEFHS